MEKFILHVEEIAIAVKDAEKVANEFFDLFGIKFNLKWELENEKISVRSARIGDSQLQFIEPINNEGVVANFLEKKGEGLNHIALKVKKLDALIDKLKEKGIKLIPEKPVEAENLPAFSNKIRYIFIHPDSFHGVLIELIEELEV